MARTERLFGSLGEEEVCQIDALRTTKLTRAPRDPSGRRGTTGAATRVRTRDAPARVAPSTRESQRATDAERWASFDASLFAPMRPLSRVSIRTAPSGGRRASRRRRSAHQPAVPVEHGLSASRRARQNGSLQAVATLCRSGQVGWRQPRRRREELPVGRAAACARQRGECHLFPAYGGKGATRPAMRSMSRNDRISTTIRHAWLAAVPCAAHWPRVASQRSSEAGRAL
jgi:hypothetical protein